jgi:hypothetical protein
MMRYNNCENYYKHKHVNMPITLEQPIAEPQEPTEPEGLKFITNPAEDGHATEASIAVYNAMDDEVVRRRADGDEDLRLAKRTLGVAQRAMDHAFDAHMPEWTDDQHRSRGYIPPKPRLPQDTQSTGAFSPVKRQEASTLQDNVVAAEAVKSLDALNPEPKISEDPSAKLAPEPGQVPPKPENASLSQSDFDPVPNAQDVRKAKEPTFYTSAEAHVLRTALEHAATQPLNEADENQAANVKLMRSVLKKYFSESVTDTPEADELAPSDGFAKTREQIRQLPAVAEEDRRPGLKKRIAETTGSMVHGARVAVTAGVLAAAAMVQLRDRR